MSQESTLKVQRSHSEEVNDRLLRGDALLRSEHYQQALNIFEEVIAINPENSRVYVYAAEALIGLDNLEKALEYINQALKVNAMNPLVRVVAGEIYLRLEHRDEALEHFKKASEVDSTSAGAYYGMGQVFYECQEYDQAIKMFRQASALDRKYRKAYDALAKTYLAKMGEEEEGRIEIKNSDDVLELIERNAHIFVVEEDDLTKMFGSTTRQELEEQIANLDYIISWLGALREEFQWQANYIQEALDSRSRPTAQSPLETSL